MESLTLECLKVSAPGGTAPFPDWAMSAVEIGAWARHVAGSIDCRLLVCCVVPCRSVFTALVGLGAVASGGTLFRKGFTWEDLLNLNPGTEIFWAIKGENRKFAGIIGHHEEIGEQTLVPVILKKGPPKKMGRWFFSEAKFRECIFSEEKLPSGSASDQFEMAKRFYRNLGVPAGSSWLMTAGAEVRFVANRTAFMRSLEGWTVTSGATSDALSLDQMLILRDEGDQSLAKARITYHLGSFVNDCPVSILDGPLAFQRIPDIQSGSLVVILERNELAEEHIDLLISARDEHFAESEPKLAARLPRNIPAVVEITGYCVKSY